VANWILNRTWAIFFFSVLWGAYMLLVGAIPHWVNSTSIFSLTFEYRDYLLRLFVVFALAHLFVRQTNFYLLAAIPILTLGLQLAIDVYDFSEWYSRTYRVNLHELNAQLFVVPVQVAVLVTGIYFCCRKHLRTTTRTFATVMMAGSLLSTLGFHLSIVNVSYKPLERIYTANLKTLAMLDEPLPTCEAMGFDCQFYSLGSLDWKEGLLLDPQLRLAHEMMFDEVMATHAWIRRGAGTDHWLGLASPGADGVAVAEAMIPMDVLAPVMSAAFGEASCRSAASFRCWESESARSVVPVLPYSKAIIQTLMDSPTFIHAWAHVFDFDGDGYLEPALYAAGRVDGGVLRVAASPLPGDQMDALSRALSEGQCEGLQCRRFTSESEIEAPYPASLIALLAKVDGGTYKAPARLWVDKALSRNPVLYINRPEFLRFYAYKDGRIRVFTSPQSFSDTTLDLKLTFNLIIAIFSISWLTLGVFLILFHTRRQLLASMKR